MYSIFAQILSFGLKMVIYACFFVFVAKGAENTNYINTIEVLISSTNKESNIKYKHLVWQIAIYLKRVESGKSFDALPQTYTLLTIALKNEENTLTTYRIVSDENENYMIHHDEKFFYIDREDYLMFCHLLEASIPATEQTYITVNKTTAKIDAHDAIIIKKETLNAKTVYSAYIIPNIYMSNTMHYVRISEKYSTLHELLTLDETILAIRNNVFWLFPLSCRYRNSGLSSDEKNSIVKYVINNRLNSNGYSWELLREFYSFAIAHSLLY